MVCSIAQHELYGSLTGGQHHLLRVLGRQQQRDHVGGLRLALGIGLEILAGGQNFNILQHDLGGGHRGCGFIGTEGDQDIDMGAGKQEPGDPYHFIGLHRGRTHPFRDLHRQSDS